MINKSIIDNIAAIKELVHDIRSPLSSIKIRVLYSPYIHGISRCILEEEINRVSQILNESSKKYSTHKDILTAIAELVDELSIPLSIMRMSIASLNTPDIYEQSFLCKELNRIFGILESYTHKYSDEIVCVAENSMVLASHVISNIITEKESEYQNYPIQIRYTFTPNSNTATIKINQSDLERMLSNLINNSVDACNGKDGTIYINLNKREDDVKITISDNGYGIPPEVLDKIRNNEMVTCGKDNGQGIGYKQIRETLAKNGATLSIESNQEFQRTMVVLTFPKSKYIE